MSRRTAVAIAAALATIAGLVALVVRSARDGSDRSTIPAPLGVLPTLAPARPAAGVPASPTHVGPTRSEAGVPMGFAHSTAGAEAAGAAFVTAGPLLASMDEAGAIDAQRAMASASSAERLVADLQSQLAALTEGFGPGPLRWWLAPLATRVRPDGPDAAEVTVWYVSVVAPAELVPYVDWRVVTRRLVWERDDWRVDAETDVPGPRPTTLPRLEPSAPAEFVAALADFNTIGVTVGVPR